MDVGVIENQDGSVRIVVPVEGFTVQDNFDRIGEDGVIIDRTAIPDSRTFRNAWVMNSTGDGVIVDVEKAKALVIAMNEDKSKKEIEAMRPDFEEAYDTDDEVVLALIKSDRQNIRDSLTNIINGINNCTDVNCIESYIP